MPTAPASPEPAKSLRHKRAAASRTIVQEYRKVTGDRSRQERRGIYPQRLSGSHPQFSEPAQELDDPPLRPPAVVAIGVGNERTVAAIGALDEFQVRICENLFPRLRNEPHERIVGGMHDQAGNRYAVDDIGGRRARIVVHGAFEATIVGGDLIVELAQAAHAAQPRRVELSRKQPSLLPE